MDRIIYKCRKCGWKKSITAAYEDIRPRRCLGKKCKTFFTLNPELLQIIKPKPPEVQEPVQVKKKETTKWTKKKSKKRRS